MTDVIDGIREFAKGVISRSGDGGLAVPVSDNAEIVVKTDDLNNRPDSGEDNKPVKSVVVGLRFSF
ncbi:MAG: hypothetical protein MJZ81_09610 [Bacteroidales bacterium]|nr:hypothetical protein [Bacteroidales bacterium]